MRRGSHCIDCAAPLLPGPLIPRCRSCHGGFMDAMYACNRAISRAVAKGVMPKAKTQTCVDCGADAHHWDHRDYRKPLDVQPVCRACNFKRGPAIWRAPTTGTA